MHTGMLALTWDIFSLRTIKKCGEFMTGKWGLSRQPPKQAPLGSFELCSPFILKQLTIPLKIFPMSLYPRYTPRWKHQTVLHGLNKKRIITVLF